MIRRYAAPLFAAVFASAAASVRFAHQPAPPLFRDLAVRLQPQDATHWCWAAAAQMVVEFLGAPPKRQCELVSTMLGLPGCCSTVSSQCNRDALPNFGALGYKSKQDVGNFDFWRIQDEVGVRSRPFVFSWLTKGASSHFLIAKGYHTTDIGEQNVIVMNPEREANARYQDTVTYAEWKAAGLRKLSLVYSEIRE